MQTTTVTCPRCGHTDNVRATSALVPADEVLLCSECGTRVAFGEVVPRVVIEPRDRLIVLRIQRPDEPDVEVPMDPAFAVSVARNLLSLVKTP